MGCESHTAMMAAAKVSVTKAVTAEMAAAMMPATVTAAMTAAMTATVAAPRGRRLRLAPAPHLTAGLPTQSRRFQ